MHSRFGEELHAASVVLAESDVRQIYDWSIRRGSSVWLRAGGRVFEAFPRRVEGRGNCWELLGASPEILHRELDVTLSVAGCYSVYELHVKNAIRSGRQLFMPDVSSGVRTRRRAHRRIPGEIGDVIECDVNGRVCEFPLKTLAAGGFSFCVPEAQSTSIPWFSCRWVLRTREGLRLVIDARLKWARTWAPYGLLCAVEAYTDSREQAAPFVAWLQSRLYPSAHVATTDDESVWTLFSEAGYFSLSGKHPGDFTSDKNAYFSFVAATRSGRDIARRADVFSAGRLEGTKGFLKPYSATWLNQHMAKRQSQRAASRKTLRDMYFAAYEPLILDRNCRWILAMCEGSVKWTKLAHLTFARRYEAAGLAYTQDFRLFEGAARCDQHTSEIEIVDASAELRAQVLDTLAATRSSIYLDALDLRTQTFELTAVQDTWSAAGLQRSRWIQVAVDRGRALAAAIIEWGTPGSNLFHLVDAVRIVALEPLSPAQTGRTYSALLASAARHFHGLGHRAFAYYREVSEGTHTEGLRDLGPGTMCVFSHQLLPEFLDHIWQITTDPKELKDAEQGRAERTVQP